MDRIVKFPGGREGKGRADAPVALNDFLKPQPTATVDVSIPIISRWRGFGVRAAAFTCLTARDYRAASAFWSVHVARLKSELARQSIDAKRVAALLAGYTAAVRDEVAALRRERKSRGLWAAEAVEAAIAQSMRRAPVAAKRPAAQTGTAPVEPLGPGRGASK
jgi:hypothetical protein